MAEREGQLQRHQPAGAGGQPVEGIKSLIHDKGPTATQVLPVAALLPVGGILLALSGMTLTGTVAGLDRRRPLFLLFSPSLVPAAVVIGLAVTGFLASEAFGLTAVTSLSWTFNYVRGAKGRVPEQMEHMKRRMAATAGQVGQRVRDVGQGIQNKAQ